MTNAADGVRVIRAEHGAQVTIVAAAIAASTTDDIKSLFPTERAITINDDHTDRADG